MGFPDLSILCKLWPVLADFVLILDPAALVRHGHYDGRQALCRAEHIDQGVAVEPVVLVNPAK